MPKKFYEINPWSNVWEKDTSLLQQPAHSNGRLYSQTLDLDYKPAGDKHSSLFWCSVSDSEILMRWL